MKVNLLKSQCLPYIQLLQNRKFPSHLLNELAHELQRRNKHQSQKELENESNLAKNSTKWTQEQLEQLLQDGNSLGVSLENDLKTIFQVNFAFLYCFFLIVLVCATRSHNCAKNGNKRQLKL
jgi:hypothetical protein